jgi:hypothetical protein
MSIVQDIAIVVGVIIVPLVFGGFLVFLAHKLIVSLIPKHPVNENRKSGPANRGESDSH